VSATIELPEKARELFVRDEIPAELGWTTWLHQFECGGSRRLLYSIHEETRAVLIEYLGVHPPWEQRGKAGG
jgi:hypothetical protein